MSSSCCGGNCGCGAGCKCGSSCKGCKMYPDMSSGEKNTTPDTLILGVAPSKQSGNDGAAGAEKEGCMCSPCMCNPCMCT
ncbi:metallothionein-like protein type 2 [Cynara cardunculus var. scolymus]|uniref:Metallothionein-like protein n=1 Tax=Cynara cardunculus var. scolymus TaxID=59895 RepID=A0A124SF19_CYNCS|nr:metallothionein-like protein type 2 [Cynara cardunculus var. scolymus]KVI01862.1 Metallothionein, family 15, plant [Cynara cardunculus var. scolymus]